MYISKTRYLLKRLGLGVIAGFAGTLALSGLQEASRLWLPATVTPFEREGRIVIVRKLENLLPEATAARISTSLRSTVAGLMALSYGLTTGVIYVILRPWGGGLIVDGVSLGLATWAVGYLGWIPALRLAPPVWKEELGAAIGPMARHIGFGVVTVGTYCWLKDRI